MFVVYGYLTCGNTHGAVNDACIDQMKCDPECSQVMHWSYMVILDENSDLSQLTICDWITCYAC